MGHYKVIYTYIHRIVSHPVFKLNGNFEVLTAVSGVGSNPAIATRETSQVLLAVVSGGFSSGFSRFRPTY